MQPRFVGRLGVADAVTVSNAALGFLAAVAATVEPKLAAQLVLLAAIADGLDGVVARKFGSTPSGEYLDSLADVASFGVAPAVLVFAVARQHWELTDLSVATVATFSVPALFVAMAVVRLGLYTAYEVGNEHTVGVPTTLAATLLAAAVLAGVAAPAVLLGATALLAYLMVTSVTYPDLHARDALAMGGVQALAVLAPTAFSRAIPRILLVAALAYFLLGPRCYWRDVESSDVMVRKGEEEEGQGWEEGRKEEQEEGRKETEGERSERSVREGVNGGAEGATTEASDGEGPEVADREVEGKRS
jgi:CDP-diacylglycerol--serine O-phosphatidyltransferase